MGEGLKKGRMLAQTKTFIISELGFRIVRNLAQLHKTVSSLDKGFSSYVFKSNTVLRHTHPTFKKR